MLSKRRKATCENDKQKLTCINMYFGCISCCINHYIPPTQNTWPCQCNMKKLVLHCQRLRTTFSIQGNLLKVDVSTCHCIFIDKESKPTKSSLTIFSTPATKLAVISPIGCTIACLQIWHPLLDNVNEPSDQCHGCASQSYQNPCLRRVFHFDPATSPSIACDIP